jgi:hypothetical protein
MMEAARSTSASKEWRAAMVAAERARCSENMAGRAGGRRRVTMPWRRRTARRDRGWMGAGLLAGETVAAGF